MNISSRLAAVLFALSLVACGHGDNDHPDAASQTVEREAARSGGSVESNDIDWAELLPNARQPLEGVVSGGQPSEDQLAMAAAAGYKSVINLRMPSENGLPGESERVAELGLEYLSLPIDGANGITEENARALADALDTAERPALLHCGSGNRVGALLALSSYYVDGESAEEAIQFGLESSLTGLEPVVRERLGQGGGD